MLLKEGQLIGERRGEKRSLELERKSQKIEIVQNMLSKNIDLKTISEVTNPSLNEMNKIKG